jgi:hypothetical protein
MIRVAELRLSGEVAVQQQVPGSEDGKYPHLAVLDSVTAIVGWTEARAEGSTIRLARVSLR